MLPKNTTCSVKGISSIIDKHSCQTAIEAMKIASSIKSETEAEYPKGCYQHNKGKVYFNTDLVVVVFTLQLGVVVAGFHLGIVVVGFHLGVFVVGFHLGLVFVGFHCGVVVFQ